MQPEPQNAQVFCGSTHGTCPNLETLNSSKSKGSSWPGTISVRLYEHCECIYILDAVPCIVWLVVNTAHTQGLFACRYSRCKRPALRWCISAHEHHNRQKELHGWQCGQCYPIPPGNMDLLGRVTFSSSSSQYVLALHFTFSCANTATNDMTARGCEQR